MASQRSLSQRITRSSQRMYGIEEDDDDFNLMLSQSHEEDGLGLVSQHTQPALSLDDSTVNELAASTASVKMNVAHVERIIKRNQTKLVKQNEELLNLISGISANVDEINDRVNNLEKNVRVMNIRLKNNKEVLDNVQDDLDKVRKSVRVLTKKQNDSASNFNNDYEQRLKLIESKLRARELDVRNGSTHNHIKKTNDMSEDDTTILVKNLPYGQIDIEDTNNLLQDGLGLNVEVQSVSREPSVRNRAGVLSVKLRSRNEAEQVMRNKMKLRYTERYYDVYIDSQHTSQQRRIENKFKMLMDLQNDRSYGYKDSGRNTQDNAIPHHHRSIYHNRRQIHRQ